MGVRKKVRMFLNNIFVRKVNHRCWTWSAVGLGVIFVLLVSYHYHADFQRAVNGVLWGTQQEVRVGDDGAKFMLPVTVVYNSSSSEQKTKMDKLLANLADPTTALKNTELKITWLDAKTPEVQALIAQSGLKYLPQLFVDAAIKKHPQFAGFQQYLEKAGGMYFIRLAPLEILEPPLANEDDHFKNDPKSAKVVVVAYESLLCDHCATEQKILKDLLKLYGQKLAVVYRHFEPGDFNNGYAQGLECAGDQQKYFEMQDKLYADQAGVLKELEKMAYDDARTDEDATKILRKEQEKAAKNLGLKLKDFQACLDANIHKVAIEKQATEALNYGISGPPAFFINREFRSGALSFDEFKTLIDAELK